MRTTLVLMTMLAGTTASAAPAQPTGSSIPGYTYSSPMLKRSPITLDEFEKIKEAALFTDEDVRYLHMAGETLVPQTEQILDVWYGFVGSHPFLAYYFGAAAKGGLNTEYLMRVRGRFGRWIKDTTDANYDQAWLDYQYEIGLRHTTAAKNRTDHVKSVPQVSYRYMPAFIVPISATIEPFLRKGGRSEDDVRKMLAAWNKAVTLQVILWSQPYVKPGAF